MGKSDSSTSKNMQEATPPEAVSIDDDDVTYNNNNIVLKTFAEVKDIKVEESPELSEDVDEKSSEESDEEEEESKFVSDIEEETYYNETIPIADLKKGILKTPTLLVLPEPPKKTKSVRFNLPDLPPEDLHRDEFKDLSLFGKDLQESKIEDTEKECDDLFAKIRARFNSN